MAVLTVGKLIKPAKRSIVDSLGNVEAKVESTVVAPSKDQHELSSFVLGLAYF